MTWIEVIIIVVILTIIGALATNIKPRSDCLRHGYPQMQRAVNLKVYCIKRINQTDSVVALSSLK